jgi:hypothetical protein
MLKVPSTFFCLRKRGLRLAVAGVLTMLKACPSAVVRLEEVGHRKSVEDE